MLAISYPQVSIVMPVYNEERYVAEAIESILSQTFSNFEFLIFDDGSKDGSREIIRWYARRDGRIALFEKPHKGYVPWLNEGVSLARGEFVARMDADDVSLANRLAEQVDFLRCNARSVAVGCDLLVIDDNGDILGVDLHERQPAKIEELLLNGTLGVITHPAALIRRQALLEIGSYRAEFEGLEDLDLWLRLTAVGQLNNLPNVLFKYRMHPSSVCSTRFRIQERHAGLIIAEARTRRGLEPLKRRIWPVVHPSDDEAARLQLWSGCFISFGNRPIALRYALLALLRQPSSLTSWIALGRVVLPTQLKTVLKFFIPSTSHS
jgi:glycosyltransferase involved in cell wall biosynthesis